MLYKASNSENQTFNPLDYQPFTPESFSRLFGRYLSSFDTSTSFKDKEDNVLKLLKSDAFAELSKTDKEQVINEPYENLPAVHYLGVHKADNILKYLFDEELIDFENGVAIETLSTRKYGSSMLRQYVEDVIKYNLKQYLESYFDLTLALFLPNTTVSKERLTLMVNNSSKASLFNQTAYSMLPNMQTPYNLVNKILKLSVQQQHTLYIAHLLDIEIKRQFPTPTQNPIDNKLLVQAIAEIGSSSSSNNSRDIKIKANFNNDDILRKFTKSFKTINKEYNELLILLMNLTKEYLAPADCYPKLYNKFIAIIKDKLSKIYNTKVNNKQSIFNSLKLKSKGDAELLIYYFLSNNDINITFEYNRSLLFEAIERKSNSLTHFFITHCVDLNLLDQERYSALHLATMRCQVNLIKLLLTHGADPNILNKHLETALIGAIWCKSYYRNDIDLLEIIKALIDWPSTDINKPGEYGATPLHKAVKYNFPDIVKMLLDRGADKNIKDNDGLTPLDFAKKLTFEEERTQIIKLLEGKIFSEKIQINKTSTCEKALDKDHTEERKSLRKKSKPVINLPFLGGSELGYIQQEFSPLSSTSLPDQVERSSISGQNINAEQNTSIKEMLKGHKKSADALATGKQFPSNNAFFK